MCDNSTGILNCKHGFGKFVVKFCILISLVEANSGLQGLANESAADHSREAVCSALRTAQKYCCNLKFQL